MHSPKGFTNLKQTTHKVPVFSVSLKVHVCFELMLYVQVDYFSVMSVPSWVEPALKAEVNVYTLEPVELILKWSTLPVKPLHS